MMKLLLACVAVALLAPEVELSRYYNRRSTMLLEERYKKAGLYPVLFSKVPNQLTCFYGDIEVTPGKYLSSEDTCGQLSIEYDEYESGCYYTMMVVDCDFYDDSYMILSYIANIVDINNYFDSGVTLASYCPPLFATVTERKRIVIILSRQPNEIDSSNCIENSYDKQRYQFDFVDYLSNNDIVAATFYYYNCQGNQENYSD